VTALDSIDHLVVLMLENRSFDHMLGFLYPASDQFDGLNGTETNEDTEGNPVSVFEITPTMQNAYWYPLCNPAEGYSATNMQLFGSTVPPDPPTATNSGFVMSFESALAKPVDAPLAGASASSCMGIYTPTMLPIISGLAKGYAVCDAWFASVPSETMPNRAFALAGTSLGQLKDTPKFFDTKSIFGALTDQQVSWKIYGYSAQPYTQMDFPDTRSAPSSQFGLFSDFVSDARNGTLPAFSFLEPEWANYREPTLINDQDENDQHPVSSLAKGEQFIYDTYQALRAGRWDKTLFVLTYDEHGGCYDHVPPPLGAVAPDNNVSDQGFDFTRFGVRVPTVLISPLIPPGTIYRAPAGGPPFDHTSLLATIRQRWGAGPLTKRDSAAPDIGSVLTLGNPRTDDPLDGVQPPAYAAPVGARAAALGTRTTRVLSAYARKAAELPVPGSAIKDPVRAVANLQTAADHRHFIEDRIIRWNAAKTGAASS